MTLEEIKERIREIKTLADVKALRREIGPSAAETALQEQRLAHIDDLQDACKFDEDYPGAEAMRAKCTADCCANAWKNTSRFISDGHSPNTSPHRILTVFTNIHLSPKNSYMRSCHFSGITQARKQYPEFAKDKKNNE